MDCPPSLQLVLTLHHQFYYNYGKLQGFKIIGDKTRGAEEIISQERQTVIIEIKTLWEAFSTVVRKELTIEPKNLIIDYKQDSDNDHFLQALEQLQDEMAQVGIDQVYFAHLKKWYSTILNQEHMGINMRLR